MRHLAIFGDVFDDHNLRDGGLLLASSVIDQVNTLSNGSARAQGGPPRNKVY